MGFSVVFHSEKITGLGNFMLNIPLLHLMILFWNIFFLFWNVLFLFFCSFGKVILSRDGTGQRSLSRDICSCPCPGTKGHRDENFFLSRDKGTTRRPVLLCPGTSRGTSRPVETLVRSTKDGWLNGHCG